MVRWRACLMLAVLLLLPRTGGKIEDDEDEDTKSRDINGDNILRSRNDDTEDDDDDDDDDDEEEPAEKLEPAGRRAPALLLPSPKPQALTRTAKKLPLECFVCAYKSATPLRSCLDPAKYRVHSITCHSVDEKCFTSVVAKGKSFDAVVRGCRTGCVATAETTCCEVNRCNNQAFAMPLLTRQLVEASSDSKNTKSHPTSVLFFVTILLVLQTVVKVSFV